ncbi:MAG: LytR C-terminal domain-containing protein [Actinomycetes bacterium]
MSKVKNQDAIDLLKADFEHVGRHRARKTAKERWIEVAWLALASVILSSSGYFGLQYAVNAMATPAPTHKIVNGIDLSTPITVIDGSGTRTYASRIGQVLLDADYVVPYSRTIDNLIPKSSIRIKEEQFRPLAKLMQKVLGKLPIELDPASKYPIEVRLGPDYDPLG